MTKDEEGSKSIRQYLTKIRKARKKGEAVSAINRVAGASVVGASIKMASAIKKRMKWNESPIITIRRRELSMKFGNNVVVDPDRSKQKVKESVRKHLKKRGIHLRYGKGKFNGLIDFIKEEAL